MPQDAFTLRHIARELDEELCGGKVNKIIQPSRDEVDILFYANGKTRKLALNTNASFARAILSDIPRSAPDTAPNFCMLLRKHLAGAQLLSVRLQGFERILAFTFDCRNEFTRATRVLYAEIMGKYSNLVLTENGIISGALKVSSLQENFRRALFPGVKYLPPEPQDKADPSDFDALLGRIRAFAGGDFAEFLFSNLSGLALPAGKPLTLGAYARQCLRRTLEIGKQAFAAPLGIVYQTSLTLRQDAPPYALQAIRAALEGVLFSLTEKYTPAKDIPDDAAAHILTILRGCVGERLTIKDLAARLGYSAAYLKKTFKTRTGESIMQTFIRMKIERAKQLLAEGVEVGYSDKVRSGFRIGEKNGGYYISFSEEDFDALLSEFLKEKVAKMLYADK